MLGSFPNHVGLTLESFYGHAGITLGSFVNDFDVILDNYDGEQKRQMKGQVNKLIKRHYNVTDYKIPDEKPHMKSGANWKFFTKILLKGDLKDRQAGSMQILGNAERKIQGVSDEEAFVRYGKKQ